MRVLHVIPSISPIRGGPSQAIFEMVHALRSAGIDAEIATTNDNANQAKLELPLNCKYHYTTATGVMAPLYCFDRHASTASFIHEFTFSKGLTSFLWKNIRNYDLIHIHAIFSYPSVAAMAIANFHHIPYVVRPLGSLCQWSLEQSKTQKSIYLGLIRRFLRQSAGLHFTAEQEAAEVSPLNFSNKGFVVPLGLDFPEELESNAGHIRQQFEIDNDDPILLFLSRIHPKKGIEPLLEAISQLTDHSCNLILAGSGDDDYEAQIKQLILEHQLEQRVKTVGFVQGSLKQQLLTQADLFVLTSYSENFGIVVLEALAAGTPVVLTPGVALAALVQAHDLGWVCDLTPTAISQALEAALSNPQMRHDKGRQAAQLVRANYSWKAIAQQLKHQYQRLCPPSASNPHPHSSAVKNA